MANKKLAPIPPRMSQQQFGKLCGVVGATVKQWREAGLPAVGGGSKGTTGTVTIETAKGIEWLATRMREARSRNNKDRQDKERADKLARENAEARGLLIDKVQIGNVWMQSIADLTGAMEGMPGRLCNKLAAIDDPAVIRRELRDELRNIRNAYSNKLRELAEFDASNFGCGVTTEDAPE